MIQEEKQGSVIVGLCSDIAKLIRVWEEVKKIFSDYAQAAFEAAESVKDLFENPFDLDRQYWSEEDVEMLLADIDECNNVSCMSPRRPPKKILPHYNYILTAPRNMPYQRRAY